MQKQYRHILFAVIAFVVCCFVPPLAAQGHAPAAQSEHVHSSAPHSDPHSHSDVPETEHTAHAAHSSDVHAGHGHDDDGGHHGKPIVFFGKEFGDAGQFFLKLVNFLIFAGLLYWLLKGILSKAFKARASEIEEKLARSEKDRAEGQSQLRDLEAKMAGLQQELGGIMAKAESEAEAEKQRILEAAKVEAEQIIAQAQSEIEYQKRLAEMELRELVAKLAVEGAESKIRQQVQGNAVTRIMDQAIQQIGGAN
jgi:F-type H+-transporting ATPase subunit b